jgi:putative ABC transport system substrate-binding protein
MGIKAIVVFVVGLTLASVHSAEAQQKGKMIKIGEVIFGTRPGRGMGIGRQSWRRELRQLGYIEGKNVNFEVRSADGKIERFPALIDELVRLKVDVILATSFSEILAAKNATKTIPIVFVTSGLCRRFPRNGRRIRSCSIRFAPMRGSRSASNIFEFTAK